MAVRVFRDISSILRGNVLILFITWILLSFGENMVHRFDGIYFSALGASDVILGYMASLTFGMMALLQIPGGHLADTLGRKKVIVTFTFVMAFSMLIFAFTPNWQFVVIGLVISNISMLYQPALFSIIMDSLPPGRRAEGFAITNLSSLPALIAPAVGGYILYTMGVISGMRLGYIILFILAFTAGILRLFLKETLKKKKEERDKFAAYFKVLKNVNFRAKGIIVVGSLVSASSGMVNYFVIKYAYTYTSSLIFGIAMGISMLISAVTGIFIGRMGDSRGKERFYIAGILLLTLSLTIFIFPAAIFLFTYAIISGLGSAFFQPSNQGLIADLVSAERRGRFTGVFLFISYLSAMAFSMGAGYLYSISPVILFSFSATLSLIAGLIAIKIFIHN